MLLLSWLGFFAGSGKSRGFALGPLPVAPSGPEVDTKDSAEMIMANDTEGMFAWHPLFMSLAFMVFFAEQAIAYSKRAWPTRGMSLRDLKIFHSTAQISEAALLLLGVVSVFASKQLKRPDPYFHFYSVHSMTALLVVGGFALHWITSIGAYLGPSSPATRRAVAPAHRTSLQLIYKLAMAAILGGLQNYQSLIMQRKALAGERLVHGDPAIFLPQALGALVLTSGMGVFLTNLPSAEEGAAVEAAREEGAAEEVKQPLLD